MAAKSTRQPALAAPPAASSPFPGAIVHPGSLLSVNDLSLGEVEAVLRAGDALAGEAPEKSARLLAVRRVALLFYEASTRTRVSFELAAKALGAHATVITAQASSIEKGESLKDTGLTLRAMGVETIVLRHPASGAAHTLALATGIPILNAGDGTHEHPSQALLDLRTILQWAASTKVPQLDSKTLRGLTVTICGDILHSRVARSNTLLLTRLGARVLLCGPPELLPDEAAELAPGGAVEVRRDFDACLRESQIVMMLRIQKERLQNLQLDLDKYIAGFQLHARRQQRFAPRALVLHPGPMVRGLEITSAVADSANSAITRQVANGVAVRMALLARTFDRKGAQA
jgi:aspartate carbamoyltransferase catalytic subunit